MPTLAATLKQEVRRIAARELRKALRPLRRVQRHVKNLRLASRGHGRSLATLDRRVSRLRARVARAAAGAAAMKRRSKGPRVAPEAIRALRDRLRMTRLQFAKLLAVSPGSIFGWETGRTVPRGKSVSRILEVKKLGVRAARAGSGGPKRGPRRRRRGSKA